MSFAIGILSILFFSTVLWFIIGSKVLNLKTFALILFIKSVFAIFTCIYYGFEDIYHFQQDANQLTEIFCFNFEGYKDIILYDDYSLTGIQGKLYYWVKPRAFFMAKVLSVLNLITGNNIYLNSILLTLINYLGILFLLNAIKKFAPEFFTVSFLVLCLVPSIVFNTSGLEKEVLVMAGIYSIIGFGIEIYNKRLTIFGVILFVIGVFLVYKVKYYYLAVIGPLGATYLVSHFISNKWFKYGLALVCFGIMLYFSRYIHPYLAPDLAFESTVDANNQLILRSQEGMYIPFGFKDYTLIEFLVNLPLALVYGLFGPFLWEVQNFAMLYISVENVLILIVSGWFVYKLIKKEIKWTYLGVLASLYVFSLAIILAFYSPNFGTLTRYKVSFLPIMLMFLTFHTIGKKLQNSLFQKFISK